MPTALELSIYKTLAYFDYFKYPLTIFEIWKWLLEPEVPGTYFDIWRTLQTSDWLRDKVKQREGYYALSEIEPSYRQRHQNFIDAVGKYRKVTKHVRWMGVLPGVQGIAVCNSLAWYNTTTQSDIDFFIVTQPGQTWLTRLLATVPLMLLRQRPGERADSPICLSFFCSQERLGFNSLKIGNTDPYLAYWSYSLVPLLGEWQSQFQTENAWLKTALPNAFGVTRPWRFRLNLSWRLPSLHWLESFAKKLQLTRLPASIQELMNVDTRVIVTDQMLKFHDQDSREHILLSLQRRLEHL
jgi:hypothetical protein